jgi:hypothetical protein
MEVQKNNITEQGETEATEALAARWRDYTTHYDGFLQEPKSEVLKQLYFTELYPRFLTVKAGAEVILAMNQDAPWLGKATVRRFAAP